MWLDGWLVYYCDNCRNIGIAISSLVFYTNNVPNHVASPEEMSRRLSYFKEKARRARVWIRGRVGPAQCFDRHGNGRQSASFGYDGVVFAEDDPGAHEGSYIAVSLTHSHLTIYLASIQ
jgi:hypothetical protein